MKAIFLLLPLIMSVSYVPCDSLSNILNETDCTRYSTIDDSCCMAVNTQSFTRTCKSIPRSRTLESLEKQQINNTKYYCMFHEYPETNKYGLKKCGPSNPSSLADCRQANTEKDHCCIVLSKLGHFCAFNPVQINDDSQSTDENFASALIGMNMFCSN